MTTTWFALKRDGTWLCEWNADVRLPFYNLLLSDVQEVHLVPTDGVGTYTILSLKEGERPRKKTVHTFQVDLGNPPDNPRRVTHETFWIETPRHVFFHFLDRDGPMLYISSEEEIPIDVKRIW